MQEDPHLGTGTYDPKTYWSERARHQDDAEWASVCVFGATSVENRCADRVQARALLPALRRAGVDGRRVLEYGCGIGRWASRIRGLGADWSGVDLSPDMCERGRRQQPGVDIQELVDGQHIPHPDASFDVVYSVTVLHHNPHDRQARILAEMDRVLKPGGWLLLLEDIGAAGSFNMFPRSHDGWVGFGESAGLRLVSSEGVRYWVLRGALASVRRRLTSGDGPSPQSAAVERSAAGGPPRRGALRRAVDHVDAWIDPWIQWMVPESARTGALFAFRK